MKCNGQYKQLTFTRQKLRELAEVAVFRIAVVVRDTVYWAEGARFLIDVSYGTANALRSKVLAHAPADEARLLATRECRTV